MYIFIHKKDNFFIYAKKEIKKNKKFCIENIEIRKIKHIIINYKFKNITTTYSFII